MIYDGRHGPKIRAIFDYLKTNPNAFSVKHPQFKQSTVRSYHIGKTEPTLSFIEALQEEAKGKINIDWILSDRGLMLKGKHEINDEIQRLTRKNTLLQERLTECMRKHEVVRTNLVKDLVSSLGRNRDLLNKIIEQITFLPDDLSKYSGQRDSLIPSEPTEVHPFQEENLTQQ